MTIVTVVIFLSEVEMTIWNLEQCHQAMLLEILVLNFSLAWTATTVK